MLSGNSGRTGPTERTGCHTASLIGMSSGVRFMTTAARSVPITGECTASGKHGGSQGALAITLITGDQAGRVYGKTLPSLEKKELRQTGLAEWIRSHPITDPEKYLAVWKRLPQMEQIWKAGLQRLTKECFHNCDNVRKLVLNPSEPGLIRALGLDASEIPPPAPVGRRHRDLGLAAA